MADRVKGITIEIGGDTTGLSKALGGVNKEIKSTQSQLKDVERLLKLDPTNTNLLQQKQKLLAKSVEETRDKLKTLKDASEQAAKTADKYDDWKKAYDPIQAEIETTNKSLVKLKAQQKEMQDCGEIDTDAYKQLTEKAEEANKKLRDLREQAKAVSDEFGHPISPEQYDSLQREIIETEQRLKSLKEESKDFGSVIAQQMKVAGEKVQEFGGKISEAGGKIADAGKKVSIISGAVATAGVGSAKMSMNFEDAMAKVGTIADTSQVPIAELEKAILELSDQTGISSVDIANNVYDAISAGQSTANAVSFVYKATTLARAGFTDTGSALDILTTIMNAYNLEAGETVNVCDTLITTQNLGKTTVAELSAAMGKVIPTAKAQNVSLKELCSAYAVMTSNGIATAETTTYLNSMLNELGKGGTSAEKALREGTKSIKKGGLSMAEAMQRGMSLTDVLQVLNVQAEKNGTTISNMFGSAEAGRAASVLLDNSTKYNDVLRQMNNNAGAIDTAYRKLETTSFRAQKSTNELKNVAIQLGDSLLQTLAPIIDSVVQKIKEFSEWFAGLSDSQKEMIVKIGLAVAAAGPLLIILGKAIQIIGGIVTGIGFLMEHSTGILTAWSKIISFIKGTMIPGIGSAAKACGTFIASTASSIWQFITGTIVPNIVALAQSFASWVSSAFTSVATFFTQTVFPMVSSAISSIVSAVGSGLAKIASFLIANPIIIIIAAAVAAIAIFGDEIQAILQKVDAFLQGVFATDWTTIFGPVLGNILNTFFADLKNIWDSVLQVFNGVIDFIRGIFTGDWERAWSGVKEIFSGIFSALYAIAVTPLNAIIGFINTIIDGINWVISGLNHIPSVNFSTVGKIPFMANGGTLLQGSAIVGEAGPELLTVAGGKAVVQPLSTNTSRIEGLLGDIAGTIGKSSGYEQPFVVKVMIDDDEIGRAAFKYSNRRSQAYGV